MEPDREMLLAQLLSEMAEPDPDASPPESDLESRLDQLTEEELQQLYSVGRFVRTLESVGPLGPEKDGSTIRGQLNKTPSDQSPAASSDVVNVGWFTDLVLAGTGGFANVYRAYDPDLQRTVALKIPHQHLSVDDAKRLRFQREARAAAMLSHEAIVPVYEAGFAGKHEYISMEWVDGQNLHKWLPNHQDEVTPQNSAAAIQRLADGLATAHARGILHRDVKPANIIVTDSEDEWHKGLKLTDFGLVRNLVDEAEQLTKSDSILGTPAYMSPEQALSEQEVTPAVDVYSLGAILYELLTGAPPHKRANFAATLLAIEKEPVKEIRKVRPDLPADLAAVCMKCLEFEPAKRYPSGRELATDLTNYLENRPVSARPIGSGGQLVRWSKRNPVVAFWMSAAFLSLVIGLAVTGWLLNKTINDKHEILAAKKESERLALVKSESLDSIASVIRQANPVLGRKSVLSASRLLNEARRDFEAKFAEDPMAQAELLSELAKGYSSLTLFSDAAECRQMSLNLLDDHLGGLDSKSLHQLQLLAEAQSDAGQLKEAIESNQELLKRSKRVARGEGLERAAQLSLADIQIELGNMDNAIQMLAFSDTETVNYGEQRRTKLLSKAYRESGLIDEALKLSEDFWQFHLSQADGKSNAAFSAKKEFVRTLAMAGQNDRAIKLAEEMLSEWTDLRGSDSVTSMELALLNGWLCIDAGRIDDAEKLADTAIAAGLERYGEAHDLISDLSRLKARCCSENGKSDSAIQILSRAIESKELESSVPNGATLDLIRDLSRQFRFEYQPKMSIALLSKYQYLIDDPTETEMEKISRLRMEYIQAKAACGQPDEVIALCREHLAMLQKRKGNGLIDEHFVWFQLMNLLFQNRDYAEALDESNKFIKEMKQHPDTFAERLRVKAKSFHAIALVENGRYAEATRVARQVHSDPALHRPYSSLMLSVRGTALANGVKEASPLPKAVRAQSDHVHDGIIMQRGTLGHFRANFKNADFNLRYLLLMCATRLEAIQRRENRIEGADSTLELINDLKGELYP